MVNFWRRISLDFALTFFEQSLHHLHLNKNSINEVLLAIYYDILLTFIPLRLFDILCPMEDLFCKLSSFLRSFIDQFNILSIKFNETTICGSALLLQNVF